MGCLGSTCEANSPQAQAARDFRLAVLSCDAAGTQFQNRAALHALNCKLWKVLTWCMYLYTYLSLLYIYIYLLALFMLPTQGAGTIGLRHSRGVVLSQTQHDCAPASRMTRMGSHHSGVPVEGCEPRSGQSVDRTLDMPSGGGRKVAAEPCYPICRLATVQYR